ncbi:MAG: hypothetical protein AAB797_01735, partial [Patescibacteria group bacterium]
VIADQHAAVNTFSSLVLTIKARSSLIFQTVKIRFSLSVREHSRKIVSCREARGEGSGGKKQPDEK